MVRRLASILVGAIVSLSANSSSSEELVRGGILTCTPNQLDRKPTVYLFNREHLVRDDQQYWLLDSLGTIGGRYLVYGGLTPSGKLIGSIQIYREYIELLSQQEVEHAAIHRYLVLFSNACRSEGRRFGSEGDQIMFRETVSRDDRYLIERVPYLPFVTCDNVFDLFTYAGELLIPDVPNVSENDLNVSKVIVDTNDWSIVVETFFKSTSILDSGPLLGERGAWQHFSWPFGASVSACQVIELDTVQIDTGNRIIENQDVPL